MDHELPRYSKISRDYGNRIIEIDYCRYLTRVSWDWKTRQGIRYLIQWMEQLEAESVLLRWSLDQLAHIQQDRSNPVGLLKWRSLLLYTTSFSWPYASCQFCRPEVVQVWVRSSICSTSWAFLGPSANRPWQRPLDLEEQWPIHSPPSSSHPCTPSSCSEWRSWRCSWSWMRRIGRDAVADSSCCRGSRGLGRNGGVRT